ncbi:MAG: UDP-N-acetylmuramate dehydrogenase [Alcaligenaceae bacterium]|nr:UDP-N-acetylmuramate dehydrogenase [Alcaligenaceae bacterium]
MSSLNIASVLSTNQDLSRYNTFSLPSEAKQYFDLKEKNHLLELADYLQNNSLLEQVFILGGGSNVVLSQQINNFVVHNQLKGIELLSEEVDCFLIKAAAGEVWHDFVQYCLTQGWHGLENLALIPGTVGAAPVQNIGAYGKEFKDFCYEVEVFDFSTKQFSTLTNKQCQFAYRDSYFKHEGQGLLIVSVTFKLPRPWQAQLNYPDLKAVLDSVESGVIQELKPEHVFEQVCSVRRFKLPDPAEIGNAGSFFKNPLVTAQQYAELKSLHAEMPAYEQSDGRYKLAAAWLIDQCGWKGKDFGKAGVHHRQALVLVNRDGAVADDIKRLAEAIKQDVFTKFNVRLEPEPIFVG